MENVLTALHKEAIAEINQICAGGIISFISETLPKLDQKITAVEEKMDEVWTAVLEESATVDEFKAVLAELRDLHLQGREDYWNIDLIQRIQE